MLEYGELERLLRLWSIKPLENGEKTWGKMTLKSQMCKTDPNLRW